MFGISFRITLAEIALRLFVNRLTNLRPQDDSMHHKPKVQIPFSDPNNVLTKLPH